MAHKFDRTPLSEKVKTETQLEQDFMKRYKVSHEQELLAFQIFKELIKTEEELWVSESKNVDEEYLQKVAIQMEQSNSIIQTLLKMQGLQNVIDLGKELAKVINEK